jgi:enterochelin esterase family protein
MKSFFSIVSCLIFLFAGVVDAQEKTEFQPQILARYQELYGKLELRDAAAASRYLTPDYTESQSGGKPSTREGRKSQWEEWLKNRVSIGPLYVTVESLEHNGDSSITATSRIVIVTSTQGKNGEINQEIVDELRRDIWTRGSQGWVMKSSELLAPPVNGEIIPGSDEPESPRLRALVERVKTQDGSALEAFWRELNGKAPLVEPIPNDNNHKLVSFVWRHSPQIERVGLYGELPFPPWGDRSLVRLPGTDVWYRTMRIPTDTRTTYGFDVFRSFFKSDKKKNSRSIPFILSVPDPRNPRVFNESSVLEFPSPSDRSFATQRADVPKGKITRENIQSNILGEERVVTFYTPPGFEVSKGTYPTVMLFDGSVYGGGQRPIIPTPTILDNLIAERRIPPVIAVLVHQKKREPELGGSTKFTQFLAEELMPVARQRYRGTSNPSQIVIGGSSLGGMAAAYAAFERPDIFGNVLSQSGAFWLPRDVNDPVRKEIIPQQTWLIDEFIERPPVKIRFWMEVSQFESPAKMLGPNRQLRDVLRAKGYPVAYRELHYGHDYLHWRESLAEGLIYLLGTLGNRQ